MNVTLPLTSEPEPPGGKDSVTHRDLLGLAETSLKPSCVRQQDRSNRRNSRETRPKPGHGKQEMFLTDTEVAGRPELTPGPPRITAS